MMTFDEALDQVVAYLRDDEKRHFEACSPKERRNHIWQAVKVLMAHQRIRQPEAT
jgi:hypothetical protein